VEGEKKKERKEEKRKASNAGEPIRDIVGALASRDLPSVYPREDRRVINLARLALKRPRRFASPEGEQLRFIIRGLE